MTDRRERLLHTLADLEAELRDLDQLDDTSRAMLTEVSREINAVLHADTTTAPLDSAAEPLQSRLSGAVTSFETSYPTLAGILQRLVDGLGQMGI